MPPWLLILFAMVLLSLAINPSGERYAWMMRLNRPHWLVGFQVWTPILWLVIYAFLYVSALTSWQTLGSWPLMGGYALLLFLLKANTWLLCSTRRLEYGALANLVCWVYSLALALILSRISPASLLGLLPLLLWSPVEAWTTWQMRSLNR